MNIDTAVQAIRDAAEKEIKKLLAEQDKPWEPDEDSWLIGGDEVPIAPNSSCRAGNYHAMGNAFPTKEAAEQAVARRKAYVVIIREVARVNREEEWFANWGNRNQKKYYNYANPETASYDVAYVSRILPEELYGCKKAIKNIIDHHADTWKIAMGISDE